MSAPRPLRVLRVYHAGGEPGHSDRDEALRRAGVQLTVVIPERWTDGDSDSGASDVGASEVVRLPVRRPGDVNRHSYFEPDRIADLAVGADLVDLHEEPFSAVVHQLLRVIPAAVPVVSYTAQNLDKRWPPPFHQWQQRAFARLGGIYPCSRQAASVVRGAGFGGHIAVLPLGVDAGSCRPGVQRHDDSEFVLGLVGRLVPEKGVTDAVRVLAALRRVRPARLLVIGRGPGGPAARALAGTLGVADSVEILDWVSPTELAQAYRRMHVVLVPSRATRTWVEQFGRVVTEGRACGAVPVGYDSGSLPEVTGDAGIVVPAGSTDALTAAVTGLATRADAWNRLRTLGLADVTSWDDVAGEQVAFYRAVLAGTPAGGSVRTGRVAAVGEFGPPASVPGGSRPFALPLLRADTVASRGLGRLLDAVSR